MSKAAEVALIIERAIVNGDLAPGTVLRQDQLSDELGVSRTPIREALQQLAARGLVSLEPNRGARVPVPSREELSERWLIRAELEALAAERAVRLITDDEVEQLRARARRAADLTRALDAASTERERRWVETGWNTANSDFHELILELADAPILRRTVLSIRGVIRGRLPWATISGFLEYTSRADEQHMAIVDTFAARDPAVARLLRVHVRDSLSILATALYDGPELQPPRLLPVGLDR